MNYQTWLNHEFSTGCVPGEDYKRFQRQIRADLKKQASEHGLAIKSFTGGHYEFHAVLESESGKLIYVSIPDVRYFRNQWHNHVLYRRMRDEKDYTGGGNHYCGWAEIGSEAARLAA